MTVNTTTSTTTALGNGATTVFTYYFYLPAAEYLVVTLTDADGNETTLTSSQYTVAGVGGATGGTVTYPLSGSPLASGWTITMTRVLPMVQDTEFTNQDAFYPDTMEDALDYVTMLIQQATNVNSVGTIATYDDAIEGTNNTNYMTPLRTRQVYEFMTGWYNVQMFGAVGDGVADDTAAIQLAVDSLPAAGGRIYFPDGTYRITDSIIVGTGDGSTASTRNAVVFEGNGCGFGVTSGPLVPCVINYDGPNDGRFMFQFQGLVSNCGMRGMYLACQGKASGIYIRAMTGFRYDNMKLVNPKTFGIYSIGGTAVGTYNLFNIYDNHQISLLTPSSVGLELTGQSFGVNNNDNWLSQFRNMRIEVVNGATNTVCMWLKFSDSCSFYRCHFDSQPEATSIGVIFDATFSGGTPNNQYPVGHAFYDCSIYNHAVYEDGTHTMRKSYFYGFGTYDNETIPTHPNLVGITDTGVIFGDFLYNGDWTSYTPTVTASSGTITTSSATGKWRKVGKQVDVEIEITITTNGTGAGQLRATLPASPGNVVTDGFAMARNTTDAYWCGAQFISGGQLVAVTKASDNSYPGADGKVVKLTGSYEVA